MTSVVLLQSNINAVQVDDNHVRVVEVSKQQQVSVIEQKQIRVALVGAQGIPGRDGINTGLSLGSATRNRDLNGKIIQISWSNGDHKDITRNSAGKVMQIDSYINDRHLQTVFNRNQDGVLIEPFKTVSEVI